VNNLNDLDDLNIFFSTILLITQASGKFTADVSRVGHSDKELAADNQLVIWSCQRDRKILHTPYKKVAGIPAS